MSPPQFPQKVLPCSSKTLRYSQESRTSYITSHHTDRFGAIAAVCDAQPTQPARAGRCRACGARDAGLLCRAAEHRWHPTGGGGGQCSADTHRLAAGWVGTSMTDQRRCQVSTSCFQGSPMDISTLLTGLHSAPRQEALGIGVKPCKWRQIVLFRQHIPAQL